MKVTGYRRGRAGISIEHGAATFDFDDVLAEPEPLPLLREPVLSRDGMVIDIGASVELPPGGRRSGMLIGLRLGYLATRFSSGWDMYEHSVNGGPDATISGPYVRTVLGGAWRR